MKIKGRRRSRNIDDKRPGTARHALSGIDNRNQLRKDLKSIKIPKSIQDTIRRRKENSDFQNMENQNLTMSRKDLNKIEKKYK